jgi:hypothetical protein
VKCGTSVYSRNVRVFVAFDDRKINDTFDAGLTGKAQRVDGLGELIRLVGHEQEQRAHTGDGCAHDIGIQQIAFHGGDACREHRFLGRPGERPNLSAASGKPCDNLRADLAGAARDEDGHCEQTPFFYRSFEKASCFRILGAGSRDLSRAGNGNVSFPA